MLGIICDIDLTIADARERLKKAGKMPGRDSMPLFQDWLDRLQTDEALSQDRPIEQVRALLNHLHLLKSCKIFYLTGRENKYRETTTEWLKTHGFPEGILNMRHKTDNRSAVDYKREFVDYITSVEDYRHWVAIDDDSDGDCSQMYREFNVVHLKVLI